MLFILNFGSFFPNKLHTKQSVGGVDRVYSTKDYTHLIVLWQLLLSCITATHYDKLSMKATNDFKDDVLLRRYYYYYLFLRYHFSRHTGKW